MKSKIIITYSYTIFCNECGKVVATEAIPNKNNYKSVEFDLTGYTCLGCSNADNFNVDKSEVKRLVLPELEETKDEIPSFA